MDLDLCCLGDAATDIGNFAAHLIEFELRNPWAAVALTAARQAFCQRSIELSHNTGTLAEDIYTTLTLDRHIEISTRFADRRSFTPDIIAFCEYRLDIEGPQRGNIRATTPLVYTALERTAASLPVERDDYVILFHIIL